MSFPSKPYTLDPGWNAQGIPSNYKGMESLQSKVLVPQVSVKIQLSQNGFTTSDSILNNTMQKPLRASLDVASRWENYIFFKKTVSHYVALNGLELAMHTRSASAS